VSVGSSGLRAFWTSLLVVGALIAASERSEACCLAGPAGQNRRRPTRPVAAATLWRVRWPKKLTETFGQSFYVENRPGASGNIGTDFVAKAPPDGYTLLLASDIQFAIGPNFDSNLPFPGKGICARELGRRCRSRACCPTLRLKPTACAN